MNKFKNNRKYSQPIIWEGDLNDDCTAKWSGLLLRAEWMDRNRWWWCVYDMMDNESQIDSSNEYKEQFTDGKVSRSKAEEVAKNYIKDLLISEIKKSTEDHDIEGLISDLKIIGISPMVSIMVLVKDFEYKYEDAKNKVFDSPIWIGLREQSEALTQLFLDAGAEDADKVEYVDGLVSSLTFDLTKDEPKKAKSFWGKLKRIIGK
jgi:hypothetical protein